MTRYAGAPPPHAPGLGGAAAPPEDPPAALDVPAAIALASFCADLRWDRIPDSARARTAELVLDLLGVAVRGSEAGSSRAVHAMVASQPSGSATVLGGSMPGSSLRATATQPLRSGAAWAALANGASAHATEMDDVTTESSLHPGAAVIPAALALAQERGASGQVTLEAIVSGYEVTMRVGNALGAASSYERGFHPTGVAGVFGAAVAAGKILGLDPSRLANAMGIAGTMASGSLEYLADGSWTKRLNPGWAAHGGIVAASLAAAGFTGPRTAIEGEHGLLRGYTDAPDPARLLDRLSTSDLQVMHVSIKPYGCCRYAHGIIDAVLALRQRHGIAPDDVAAMRLGVLEAGWSLIADPPERVRDPRNVVDAQFSAPYAAAVALVRGRAGLAEFSDETLRDPQVRMLLPRIECERDASLDAEYPKRWPAAVEIRLRDGRVLRQRVEHALGEPENPVPRDALIARFVEMLGPRAALRAQGPLPLGASAGSEQARPAARELADRVLTLDAERDLRLIDELA